MKRTTTLIILLTVSFFCDGQLNSLGSNFFFNLPTRGSKFETRAKIQGNTNFSDFAEHTVISCDFTTHQFILNIPRVDKKPDLMIWFDESGMSIRKRITLYYSGNQINDCIRSYQQIIDFFKPYTSHTEEREVINTSSEQMG